MSDYMMQVQDIREASTFRFLGRLVRACTDEFGVAYASINDFVSALGALDMSPHLRDFVRKFVRKMTIRTDGQITTESMLRSEDLYQFAFMANTPHLDEFRAKMAHVAEELRTKGYYVESAATVPRAVNGEASIATMVGANLVQQAMAIQQALADSEENRRRIEALEHSTRSEIDAVAREAREAKLIARGEDGFLTLSEFCARKGYPRVSKEVLKLEGQALRNRLDAEGRQHLYHSQKRDPGAHNSHPARPWSVAMLENEWWPTFRSKLDRRR